MQRPASPKRGRAQDLLALLGEELAGLPGVQLERSVRLREGRVEAYGRFGAWLAGGAPADFTPLGRALERLGAPAEVVRAREREERPVRQAIAVAMSDAGPELRLYLHGRDRETQADRYVGFRWLAGERARRCRYVFHFFPETPDGLRPRDVADARLADGVDLLARDERVRRLSGFWLRYQEGHRIDQVDVALPWLSVAGALAGVHAIARALAAPVDERWTALRIRHAATPVGAAVPSLTLYTSASVRERWPGTEEELEEVLSEAASSQSAQAEALFAALPPPLPGEGEGLAGFYDGDVSPWRAVLGPELHYHAGLFEPGAGLDDASMDAALRRAVTELYPFLPRGGRLYDVGCGWGGPLAMFARDLGARCLGLTESRAQFRHVAALGLAVRWGDAERTLPPGHFDCAVLLESLSHMHDKERLLRTLRPLCDRLVMRVNCQDAAPAGEAFGGTMHVVSSDALRSMIERAGFRIRHWRDRRPEALPSVRVWHRRLQAVPPAGDRHLETLRAWCGRVVPMLEAWGRHNPLVEVVAE